MDKNNKIGVKYHPVGHRCPFCGETRIDHMEGTYFCGFSGEFSEGFSGSQIASICKNYVPKPAKPEEIMDDFI